MDFDTIEEYEEQLYDIIVENYSSTSEANVDYYTQIQPIFNASCTNCRGGSGGLSLNSYSIGSFSGVIELISKILI